MSTLVFALEEAALSIELLLPLGLADLSQTYQGSPSSSSAMRTSWRAGEKDFRSSWIGEFCLTVFIVI